jgi:hypothetical protein
MKSLKINHQYKVTNTSNSLVASFFFKYTADQNFTIKIISRTLLGGSYKILMTDSKEQDIGVFVVSKHILQSCELTLI